MRKTFAGIVAFAAVILPGCAEEKPESKEIRPIRSIVAKAAELGETITQTGEIRPRVETAMSFRLDGQITYRAENGAIVRAGDILASLDRTPSKNSVLAATADLSSASSSLELAKVSAGRNRELYAKNITSRAQLQEAEANVRTAQARLEAATATLANARETLSYTDIRAQQDGIISAVGANAGQVVGPGQMVVTLISNDKRDAVFDLPERLLAEKINDPLVDISLVSNPHIVARGRVREITPLADAKTRTFRVKVGLEGAALDLPFGAAVLGKIVLSPKKLFELPASALTNKNGAAAVFVYDTASSKLQYRTVAIERFNDKTLLVSSGLSDGDVVASAGVSKLRDGERVKLEGETKK